MPDGSFASTPRRGTMPSLFSRAAVSRPKRSSPTLAMKTHAPFFAERRATATAWFAPFPPGFMRNLPPLTVSPGTGIFFPVMTMSVLVEPNTTIFFMPAILSFFAHRFNVPPQGTCFCRFMEQLQNMV